MEHSQHTPMIQQYLDLKKQCQDCFLLFRLGDFYELFFEDAVRCSEILKLTLTARYKNTDHEVPMCGMPHHSAASYIKKLTDKGVRVAICEQMEEPQPGKTLVSREVVQIVTPALPFNEDFVGEGENHYLLAIVEKVPGTFEIKNHAKFSIAYLDIVTGEYANLDIAHEQALEGEVSRLEPKEILLPNSWQNHRFALFLKNVSPTPTLVFLDQDVFEKCDKPEEILEFYLKATKNEYAFKKQTSRKAHMVLDLKTIKNLDIIHTDEDKKSLFKVLDFTKTALGKRCLKRWLKFPLLEREEILKRLAAVKSLVHKQYAREEIQKKLRHIYDLERIKSKIERGRAHPVDLKQLRESLEVMAGIGSPPVLAKIPAFAGMTTGGDDKLATTIQQALVEEPPLTLGEGGIFKEGYHKELDELIRLSRDGKSWLATYEREEKEKTGITTLKVRYNNVYGYYIEVTKSHLSKVPAHYERRQTLTGAERFITEELKNFESKILSAEDKRKKLEKELFIQLRFSLLVHVEALQRLADYVSELDVTCSLAEAANKYHYCEPSLSEEGGLELIQNRHPIVEQETAFIPNDIVMREAELHLISGPNMAGKSTVMRQAALALLMMQIGSFVSAKSAKLPLVDRIFTRIGASDDIARGESTFMVEMKEAAQILNEATPKSFIILDEVGRGTSTFDGVSLAWALAEHLADHVRALTLFATHYHELAILEKTKKNIKNFHVATQKRGDDIIFLRKLKPGALSSSFGIEVARLAGVPSSVVVRAQQVMEGLKLHTKEKTREEQDSLLQPKLFV